MVTSLLRKAGSLCLSLVITLSPFFGVGVVGADSPNDSAPGEITTHLPTNGNLPGGTPISVEITAPSDGALRAFPPGNIDLTGTTSVAEGIAVKDTTVVYALDRSGSMTLDAGVDCTGDTVNDRRDVCAQLGIVRANIAAGDPASAVGLTGLASFGNTGSTHIVDLTSGGTALLVSPIHDGNMNSQPDLRDVGITLDGIVGNQTNFADGLTAAFTILNDAANTSAVNLLIFVSDADPGSVMVGANVSTLVGIVPANTTIYTFGIGVGPSCTFDGGTGTLNDIAMLSTAGTGTCEIVTDMSKLAARIKKALGSALLHIERQLDAEPFVDITSSANPPIPPPPTGLVGPTGPVTFTESGINAAPGIHDLCVTARGKDGGGDGSVTQCIKVTVADISLSPPSATNDLGANSTHTVTATVAAGADGGVGGVPVNFEITAGPNMSSVGSGTTDSNGQATFTYTAIPAPAGLGTDVIQACFTDDQGNTACATATKTWIVTTCTILDDFNRANGPLGSDWGGRTRGYRIVSNEAAVRAGGPVYWQPDSFGPDQEACVTLTRINPHSRQHGLLLKVQEPNDWRKGAILVSYNAVSGNVDVKARDVANNKWILAGSLAPLSPVVDGDQLRAKALTDGKVEVLINDTSIGTADAGSFYAGKGGQIGLWFRGAQGHDGDGDHDGDDNGDDHRPAQVREKDGDDNEDEDHDGSARRALLDDFGGDNLQTSPVQACLDLQALTPFPQHFAGPTFTLTPLDFTNPVDVSGTPMALDLTDRPEDMDGKPELYVGFSSDAGGFKPLFAEFPSAAFPSGVKDASVELMQFNSATVSALDNAGAVIITASQNVQGVRAILPLPGPGIRRLQFNVVETLLYKICWTP